MSDTNPPTAAEIDDLFRRDERRERRRRVLYALAHHLGLPILCRACGCWISSRHLRMHERWHHHVNLIAWATGGGRGRKPKRMDPADFLGRPGSAS